MDIYDRVFDFACRVIQMDRALQRKRIVNRNVMNQLVRSATGIGSNLEEAKAGQSKADFHANVNEANEIVAILTAIAKKANPKAPS